MNFHDLVGNIRPHIRREQRVRRATRLRSRLDPSIVNPTALISLTGRERPSAQARVLETMRIPYRRRPDGSLLVYTYACVIQPLPFEPKLRP